MADQLVKDLFQELSALPEVEAIALGGSRAGRSTTRNRTTMCTSIVLLLSQKMSGGSCWGGTAR